MSWEENPEVVEQVQAGVPKAAGASLEPLQDSRLHQNVGAECEVGWAFVYTAVVCLGEQAELGGADVVGVMHWVASVA